MIGQMIVRFHEGLSRTSVKVCHQWASQFEYSDPYPLGLKDAMNFQLEFTHVVRAYSSFGLINGMISNNDAWGQLTNTKYSIERTVDVQSDDQGILA